MRVARRAGPFTRRWSERDATVSGHDDGSNNAHNPQDPHDPHDPRSPNTPAPAGTIGFDGMSIRVVGAGDARGALERLLACAPDLAGATSLALHTGPLRSRDFELMAEALRRLPSLESLSLGKNRLGSDGFGELGRYPDSMRHIKGLFVHGNDIGAVGLSEFMRTAERLESLEHLDLAENPIGDEGAGILASLAGKLPKLRQLGLFNCAIGDSGAERLLEAVRRAPWSTSLQQIGFRDNDVFFYKPLCDAYDAASWREFDWRPGRGRGRVVDDDDDAGLLDILAPDDGDPSDVNLPTFELDSDEEDPVPEAPLLSVTKQWAELAASIRAMFGAEGENQFHNRLKHKSQKTKWLQDIHDLMADNGHAVHAYERRGQTTRPPENGAKKPQKYAYETAFRAALADPRVVPAIFALVAVRSVAPREDRVRLDDPVFCCPDCGALHFPDSGIKRPQASTCCACGRRGLVTEEAPHRSQSCEQCGVDFKFRAGGAWTNSLRRAGKCPRGHRLPGPSEFE